LLLWARVDGGTSDYNLSVFFTVFVMLQFWNLFNVRCFGTNRSAFAGIFQNKSFLLIAAAILLGQIAIVQFGGRFFRTVPLLLSHWLIISGATFGVLLLGEVKRYILRSKLLVEN
jgi:P-type Ca2+ transporter type 2C